MTKSKKISFIVLGLVLSVFGFVWAIHLYIYEQALKKCPIDKCNGTADTLLCDETHLFSTEGCDCGYIGVMDGCGEREVEVIEKIDF